MYTCGREYKGSRNARDSQKDYNTFKYIFSMCILHLFYLTTL